MHPNDMDQIMQKARPFARDMASLWDKLMDFTLPILSFFNGYRFTRGIERSFGDTQIEDLLLNYFCVTTDISKGKMGVHRCGEMWKYIRASMSLQGYLPPMSEDGSYLLDGGYMNVLPADIMKKDGLSTVFAVDVSNETVRNYYPYGSSLSGWWLFFNKINPFQETVKVPSMGEVSAALAYVSSRQHKSRVIDESVDVFLKPSVSSFTVLEFDKIDEIMKIGYDHAKPIVEKWLRESPSESMCYYRKSPQGMEGKPKLLRSHTWSELSPTKRRKLWD